MSGIYRLTFFGSATVRNIYNKHWCCHITLCGTYKMIINRNIYSCVRYSGKLFPQNGRSIKANYYVKCLACSSKHVNYTEKRETDQSKNTSNTQRVKSKIVHYLKQFRFVATVFWTGCKNLFLDVKIALQTRRKLGLYHQRDYSNITREELRHMRQTKDDVVKTFPVAFLFMIPFIGYTAPILAYFFPKQLLSQQFWHPDQKKEFILEEYEKRSQYYLPLIKEIAVTCKELNIKDLYNMCFHVINGNHPSNADLLQFKDIFSKNENFSLQSVPRYHLVKLCKCWLIPTGWFLPKWYLVIALRKRISRLHEDDMLILQEGIKTLPPKSITKAVHVRGLDKSALNLESKIFWLEEWVDISSQVSGVDDVSFLAHCAVFKAENFEKHARENGKEHN